MSAQPAATPLEAARAKRLDALHAVVAVAFQYYLHHAPLPCPYGAELEAALLAEAKATNAVTAAIRADAQRATQPTLEGVA